MNDQSEAPQAATDNSDLPQAEETAQGGGLSQDVPAKLVVIPILLVAVAAGGFYAYRRAEAWQEATARQAITREEKAPEGWQGFRLHDTRARVAKLLVDAGTTWPSIQKPGMSPTPWAAHVRLTINGEFADEFSLRFSDGERWDYGRHPPVSDEVVDSEALIGSLDQEATLVGVMWKIRGSDYDQQNETVPLKVLEVLGTPATEETDITGSGKVYLWEWPAVKAYFTTVDSKVAVQLRDDAPTGN